MELKTYYYLLNTHPIYDEYNKDLCSEIVYSYLEKYSIN